MTTPNNLPSGKLADRTTRISLPQRLVAELHIKVVAEIAELRKATKEVMADLNVGKDFNEAPIVGERES